MVRLLYTVTMMVPWVTDLELYRLMQRHQRLVQEFHCASGGVKWGVLEDELQAVHQALCSEVFNRTGAKEFLEPSDVWERESVLHKAFQELQGKITTNA